MNRVLIRELGRVDADVLHAVFAGMSPQSRYLRYHAGLPHLPAGTARALAAVDGHDHVALAAFEHRAFADPRPIGLVRVIALGGGRAELAVEVVDARQGLGIGTRLIRAVRDRAAELGHHTLVAEVLAENGPIQVLLRREFPGATVRTAGVERTYLLPVTVAPAVAAA